MNNIMRIFLILVISTAINAIASAKEPIQDPNGGMIVRISEIEVYPEYLAEYLEFAKEVAEESVKNEKDVVSIYPMSVIKNNAKIKILEIYRTREAYKKHIESPHFKKYKKSTLHMVKSLELVDTLQICPSNFCRIFKKSN